MNREPLTRSLILPALLVLVAGLRGFGQETPANPPMMSVEDEGVFVVSLAGRPVGSESFKIHVSSDKIEAQGEIRLRIEQNGRTVTVQSFPGLLLDRQLRPLTYTWNQKGTQSSRLEVDFRGKLAKVRYKTVNGKEDDRDFELPSDVMVLDDNVIHHYQLIAARYQALGGGKQTFRVFVPQEALPSILSVEDGGTTASTAGGVTTELRHLLITTDVTHIDLWVTAQQQVERLSVPATQLEAIRRR